LYLSIVKNGYTSLLILCACIIACNKPIKVPASATVTTVAIYTTSDTTEQLVSFAEALIGTPYKYATSDPNVGFDCSGFISYVFHHFNFDVPRSSVDFTDKGTEIDLKQAKRGDLILFTGTNPNIRVVGHMGIITYSTPDSITFIHSTSGKQYGVAVTPLEDYYMGRFMKVIRVFDDSGKLKL
jgi:cell wall-associated NlpC family hydrolase